MLASNALIQVTPGLMIWTVVCFLITLWVLKRYAFGPIQRTIDERRERIRQAIDEADKAREEARGLLEEHRKLIGRAKTDAEEILAEARKVADANERRLLAASKVTRKTLDDDDHRRLIEEAIGELDFSVLESRD
jgi:F-type H+-transporting ATPase subunit b